MKKYLKIFLKIIWCLVLIILAICFFTYDMFLTFAIIYASNNGGNMNPLALMAGIISLFYFQWFFYYFERLTR